MRSKYFLYNTISSLLGQIIGIICGMVLPRVMIAGFGSELYGTTTSIAEFLGYIALFEGGIGGVARSALYKPLAKQDTDGINKVTTSVKQFFRKLAVIFIGYTLVIACSYKYIAAEYIYDWGFTFCLVCVISLSKLAEYYLGVTNSILVQADQKGYVVKALQSLTTIFNTILTCILIYFQCDILTVKFFYCFLHFIRILILNLYVKRKYSIQKICVKKDYLKQKWDGLGQHLAYFIHSKTDFFVLTVFMNLREVAVYSIYNYIVTSLVTLAGSFISGTEAVFGNMLAQDERNNLMNFFDLMEFMIHLVVIIIFSTAAIMFMPFIHLYTTGITDAEYYRPIVAALLLASEGIYCLRQPYHQIVIAAGEFKSTRNAAFIEAGLNMGLSCILVQKYGIAGVATATLIAMVYRTIYYIFYLSNHILKRNISKFIKRWGITVANISVILLCFYFLPLRLQEIKNYAGWIGNAILVYCVSTVIAVLFSFFFYKKEWKQFINKGMEFIKKIFQSIGTHTR